MTTRPKLADGRELAETVSDADIADWSGKRWVDGGGAYTAFTTILPLTRLLA